MLNGKNILLGVSGSIAAYKAAILVRLLVKSGANVKVVMTPSSRDFVTPLTLSTLSKNPVLTDFVSGEGSTWNNHVELGLWADLILLAPTTANTMAKMANGICDNLLLAVYLSARCPVYCAPAMDLDMYKHRATKESMKKLKAAGVTFIKPETGELASGLTGEGRMAEPENIIAFIREQMVKQMPLYGKTALVTAGPTQEAIDPVRYIGNHSSGKMGFAIAEELAARGAKVTLVCGPNNLNTAHKLIKRIDVVSAAEMHKACMKNCDKDIVIMAAAVADYQPEKKASQKIKKSVSPEVIKLKPTIDILAEIGKVKKKKQVLVGFALETENELAHAQAKLKKKNLDFIVLNSLNDKGAGFKTTTNKVTIIDHNNKTYNFELKSKTDVAKDIIDLLTPQLNYA